MQRTVSTNSLRRSAFLLFAFLAAAFLSGCGGNQDFGGFSRSLGGDISSGYNTSLGGRYSPTNGANAANVGRGTYPMIETSFQLPTIPGDPFDYEQVNVQVSLRKPDGGTVDVPAFFDGGTIWRMRYSPNAPGQYAIAAVKLNHETAHEEKLDKKDWTVNGDPQPGFVRIDRGDHSRFVFDNGGRYFPLGHNQGWRSESLPDIPTLFAKMHTAGENWSRVWMIYSDGKNLDWSPTADKKVKLGEIDLEAAKRWDAIVDAAAKNDLYFQMTFQNHGSYSRTSDSNWDANPYNVKNGGFLRSPEEFFTNPQARTLTKRKLYYILARWGYSPNIMAFELFNEVENTDAASGKHWDDIAMWHREMALFVRQYDGYRHLITTSAIPGVSLDNPVWQTVDYLQAHDYPTDVVTALSGSPSPEAKKIDKPLFVGEFGPKSLRDPEGVYLHQGLWASLMSGMAGAAEYWDWENVEKHDLYGQFKAAEAYVMASGLPNHGALTTVALPVTTTQRADLRFGPGGGWDTATQNEFVVGTTGAPAGMSRYPAYLQGQAHRVMTPKPLTFQVSYPQAGTFTVMVGQVAKAGAHLKVSVDGKAVERDYPAGDNDYAPKAEQASVQVEVPSGAHTITLENTGKDWVQLGQFSFSNYASALAAEARVGKDFVIAWIYNRAGVSAPTGKTSDLAPATGKFAIPGLKPGRYQATWWDTYNGKSLDATEITVSKEKDTVEITTPAVTRDVALYIVKAGTPSTTTASAKKPRKERSGNSTASAAPAAAPSIAPSGSASHP